MKGSLIRILILCAAVALLSCAILSGCSKRGDSITSISQLNEKGRIIAVSSDAPEEVRVRKDFPNATINGYTDVYPVYAKVAQGKTDACIHARVEMEQALKNGVTGVRILDETYCDNTVAVGISRVTPIPDLKNKINAFLQELQNDGTLDDMYERWVVEGDETMPDIPAADNPGGTIRVATTGTAMPYTYFVGTELVGYDIELARRFAAWLGMELEFKVYDWNGLLSAAQGGDADCIMSNLYYTEEHAESIDFSDALFKVEVAAMVKDDGESTQARGAYASIDELNGKRIGVQTGTTAAEVIKERLPNAQISYFSTFPDMEAALKAEKIDGFPGDGLVVRMMAAEDSSLFVMDEKLRSYDCGVVLPKNEKGDRLGKELNEWIAKAKESGELDAMVDKWVEEPEEKRTIPDYRSFPATNGVLKVTTEGTFPPMNYYRGEELAGMEVDLCARFCEAYGYGLDISSMNFDGMLAAVQTGKYDFALSGIAITNERKQSVNFSDPYYTGGYQMAVLKAKDTASASSIGSAASDFFGRVAASFEKTFLREDRWKLLLWGSATTLFITVLSVLLGTILGFAVYLACRGGNPVMNTLTRFSIWLVQGMPVVVLLMILYYIVLGKVSISGTWVSVIGFTFIFGAAVFMMLKTGVGAIGAGQMQAAAALGYTERKAFFRVVLPQTIPHILPTYIGQVTALIKATAVVGYIAVQDLTKMGDIIRSRTYEAFFPLISVAVIYFVLAGILNALVGRFGRLLDVRRRRNGMLLKGVKLHD